MTSRNPAGKPPYDDSCWIHKTIIISPNPLVRIHYISALIPSITEQGTIILIHGFPQTAYQYRYVITPLAKAGYRVICPDIRGAGASSHPPDGYEKYQLATDLHKLLYEHEKVKGKVHVVGQDIGGMIAHAFATTFPADTASVAIGECPLPGTAPYEASKNSAIMYHFAFHQVPDLPETLVTGKERIYLRHFYDRAGYNPGAITEEDLDVYATSYAQPGGLRCGFELYRAFEEDVVYNKSMVKAIGKSKLPVLALYGEFSFCKDYCKAMLEEVYGGPVEVGQIKNAAHWTTEENPVGFVEVLLKFLKKYSPAGASRSKL